MIAYIWVGLVVIGTVCGIALGNGEAVADAVMNSAGTSRLCVWAVGTYVLWLGNRISQKLWLIKNSQRRCRGLWARI